MACACKVNSQLSKIRKEYGVNENNNSKKIEINFKAVLSAFCALLACPFIISYILFIALFSKNKIVDVRKIFFRKHGKQ